LKFYNISQIDCYWTYDDQDAPTGVFDPTFAYRTGNYYQIYSPYASKDFKHRNDLPENYFFGYIQLPKGPLDLIIIDKSPKDVTFCRRLDYWAVCGKSETTMIPRDKMIEFHQRAKRVILMLDNDKAGRQQADKYIALYPWLEVKFLSAAKDKTDLCVAVGFDKAVQIIRELID
jgi:hypothetical protein